MNDLSEARAEALNRGYQLFGFGVNEDTQFLTPTGTVVFIMDVARELVAQRGENSEPVSQEG